MYAYIFQHGEVFEFPGFASRVFFFKLAALEQGPNYGSSSVRN